MIPSNESNVLAAKLIEEAIQDGSFSDARIMEARIAQALEQSWQQGVTDAESWRRVAMLREKA